MIKFTGPKEFVHRETEIANDRYRVIFYRNTNGYKAVILKGRDNSERIMTFEGDNFLESLIEVSALLTKMAEIIEET